MIVNVSGEDTEVRTWDDNMDHDDCPLHGPTSKHPLRLRPRVKVMKRRKQRPVQDTQPL